MTTIAFIGIQKGFDAERFDLYNIQHAGSRVDGSTFMVPSGTSHAAALDVAKAKVENAK